MSSTKKLPVELDIVVHEGGQRPRLLRISRSTVRLFIYLIPSLLLLTVTALVLIGLYFKELSIHQKEQESEQLKQVKVTNKYLEKKLSEMKKENNQLQKKLTAPIADSLATTLSLFIPIPGQKDLSGEGKSQIDNFKMVREVNKTVLSFNIINLTKGQERLSGYIFGIAKTKDSLHLYPGTALTSNQIPIVFNRGESFATYRFRPSNIFFNIPNNIEIEIVEIFIFSRTGDLLAKKIFSSTSGE